MVKKVIIPATFFVLFVVVVSVSLISLSGEGKTDAAPTHEEIPYALPIE